MKGKTTLFENYPKFTFRLNLQLFARKVSDLGIELQKQVSNQKLKNFIAECYRFGGKVGDGGLVAAIRHQLATGELVGDKDHLLKGKERLANLSNIMRREKLSESDMDFAKKSYKEIDDALKGK